MAELKSEKQEVKNEKQEQKSLTIAQQAGYARRKLRNRGVETMEDDKGNNVPIGYVPDIDIMKHIAAVEIIERARELRDELAHFKQEVQQAGDELYEQLMAENEIRAQSVGGFTLASFDKQLKIIFAVDTVQVKIPEELKVAEEHWKKFIDDHYDVDDEKDQILIEIVNELLHNTKDQIDLRQLGRLNRMGAKIDSKQYHAFLNHLNQAYDTQHTKRYEQFKTRSEQGDYDSLLLTYSRVDPKPDDDE